MDKLERVHRELVERLERYAVTLVERHLAILTGAGRVELREAIVGHTHPVYIEEAVKETMKHWVQGHDMILDECEEQGGKGGGFYAYVQHNRGLTFDELQTILNTGYESSRIEEGEYRYFRFFEAVMIHDKVSRRQFTLNPALQPMLKDDFGTYLKVLEYFQIPVVNFFLHFQIPAYFPFKALQRHSYLTGGSGSGKSELLKIIFYCLQGRTQAKRSASLVLFDPHSDLAVDCMQFMMNRKHRDRLIYFDLNIHRLLGTKERFKPIINPFDIEDKTPENVGSITGELVKAFVELIGQGFSDSMEAVLPPCISTVLFKPNGSIKDLQNFMVEGRNTELVKLARKNPIEEHRYFFESGGFDLPKYKQTKDAIYIRVQKLLNRPSFAKLVLGKSTINLQKELDGGKVILLNLSKGDLSDGGSFGKLVLALIQGIGFRRTATPKERRMPVFMFIDEFQNYVMESVKEMFEELRKFNMALFVAQQYVGQNVSEDFLNSLFANTNLKIIGSNDPRVLDKLSRSTGISMELLKKLPEFSFYVHNRRSKAEQKFFRVNAPANLVSKKNNHYLTKSETKELLTWFVQTSGYYVRDDSPRSEPERVRPERAERITEKQSLLHPEMAKREDNLPRSKFSE